MYCELEDFKQWAGDGIDSGLDDALLRATLEAAAAQIDEHCGRTFTVAEDEPSVRSFDSGSDGRFLLVDDFTGTPTAEVDGTAVVVTVVGGSARRPSSKLKGLFGRYVTVDVEATWGWPAVPAQVRQANLMLGLTLWSRRNNPYGTQGNDVAGFIRIAGMDRDVTQLLAPFVSWTGAIA